MLTRIGTAKALPSYFGLCARICKIVHSTRLSDRHYFRSIGRPNGTISTEWPIKRGLAVEMTLRGRDDGAFLPQRFCPPSELGNPQRTRLSTFPQRRRLRLSNRDKLPNPRQSYISTDSRAEPKMELCDTPQTVFPLYGVDLINKLVRE